MDRTVPKLDLAPKLNRPLSLWNPLDYLLLLYWVLFFPQALSWYENKYGRKSFRKLTTWPERRGVVVGVARGMAVGVVFGVAVGVGFGVAWNLSILRPENWLFGVLSSCFLGKERGILLSRITILPLPYLTSLLKPWLTRDWETGIYNLNQLLSYTLQFIPVVEATNQVLAEIPSEQLIYRVSQLTENTDDLDLVKFCSVSLSNQMKSLAIDSFLGILFFLRRWQENLKARFHTEPRLDTHPHAVAAGFWYLYDGKPEAAKEAFAVVRLGRYYFEGIWKQAAENPPGQQEIIKAFALSQDGLIEAQLLQITSLSLQG